MGSSDSCNVIADYQDTKTVSMGTGGKQTEAHSPRMFVCIGISWHDPKSLQAPAGAQTVLDMHTLTAHLPTGRFRMACGQTQTCH